MKRSSQPVRDGVRFFAGVVSVVAFVGLGSFLLMSLVYSGGLSFAVLGPTLLVAAALYIPAVIAFTGYPPEILSFLDSI